jgi:hypothetical protein
MRVLSESSVQPAAPRLDTISATQLHTAMRAAARERWIDGTAVE